ncbi:MAG: aldo/keto reductase [Candidatus Latescibacterota bacterium]|nr:MAG: aldo/keto reductase [Candidatus Latescibacterota bacterium]
MKRLTRRDFIKTTASFVAACGLTKVTGCSSSTEPTETKPPSMPTRPFGKTGVNVRIFSLGGQAALEIPGQEDLSGEIINRALDLGVNYIDTSAYYGQGLGQPGLSERNIGRAIQSRRQKVFVATKTLGRYYASAMADLEQSLQNLQTDYVDLWQLHNVRTQSDLNAIFSPNGAYKALQEAKTEGTARFIGISGHFDPNVLASAITSYEFDAVLMALNAADIHYKSFIENTLPLALERDMGIIAMKIPARGRMFREGGVETMKEALGYTLTHPVSTAIVGCSTVEDVEENVKLAKNFEPFSDDEMRRLEDLTATYYRDAAFFKYEG